MYRVWTHLGCPSKGTSRTGSEISVLVIIHTYIHIYIYIYCLFDDDISSTGCAKSIMNYAVTAQFELLSGICLKGLRNTIEKPQDSQYAS